MTAKEALAQLMEIIGYHASPADYWRADTLAGVVRAALEEGKRAKAALESALARERAYREREERMARALAVIELEAGRARR
ncbi:hypothetical protein [Thermus albus]|uniref:hypothetical protein n=1 Tax=Thermus albus TaxID=2908146 RepID=UPI001FAA64A6|nr:hypothetical protein [Thermus albus]